MSAEVWFYIGLGILALSGLIAQIKKDFGRNSNGSRPSDAFMAALTGFSIRLIKADSAKSLDDRLKFIEDYLFPIFGERATREYVSHIKKSVKDGTNSDWGNYFKNQSDYDEKMIMLDYLLAFLSYSGEITKTEMKVFRLIVERFIGISKLDFDCDVFESVYYDPLNNSEGYNSSSSEKINSEHKIEDDYKMFEININATDEELKKAYYNQVAKHHPDKVSHLGEHLQKFANEYCAKLNEAYERIKISRGMN